MWDLEQGPGPEQEDYWAWAENDVMLMRVIDPSDAGTRGRAQCVELKLRWRFCVHGSTYPEI